MRSSFVALALASSFLAINPGVAFSAENHNHGHAHDHKHDHSHGHHHHHTAPHGGTLVVLGDEAAHVELVLDAKDGSLTGYVLDGESEKAVRVAQPEIALELTGKDVKSTVTLSLKAVENALTGEKSGDTSEFKAQNDALKNLKRFDVLIKQITIKGVKFDNVKSPFPEGNH